MIQWQQSLIYLQQAGHVEMCYFNQHDEPGKLFLQASVLIIEYLVAPYELWMLLLI